MIQQLHCDSVAYSSFRALTTVTTPEKVKALERKRKLALRHTRVVRLYDSERDSVEIIVTSNIGTLDLIVEVMPVLI